MIEWSGRFVVALLALGWFATALPYVLWFTELRRASVTAVTAWTLLVPVVGVLRGVIVLGERPTTAQVVGYTIMVAALTVVANSDRHARDPATQNPRINH
ncbi:DMT family transporter [Nocardia gipuzkoensis]|uniref:DMT family transporter n=1 Tax=Nocardia gipuzkoensis TaxID=2749991 RepID=UPI001E2C4A94|nr:DMT family transporter [Nocardia gipuzkoensis]UGT67946.1 DMT family transporter [Nocardia gipuzkoensis]